MSDDDRVRADDIFVPLLEEEPRLLPEDGDVQQPPPQQRSSILASLGRITPFHFLTTSTGQQLRGSKGAAITLLERTGACQKGR